MRKRLSKNLLKDELVTLTNANPHTSCGNPIVGKKIEMGTDYFRYS